MRIVLALVAAVALSSTLFSNKASGSWCKTYGEEGYCEVLRSVCLAHDGGYVAAGGKDSLWTRLGELVVMKVDCEGRVQWSKVLDSREKGFWEVSVWQIPGGYAVNSTEERKVYEVDLHGNLRRVVELKEGQDLNYIFTNSTASPTRDGGFVIGGWGEKARGYYHYYFEGIFKFDRNGMLEWWSKLTENGAVFDFVIQTSDGGYFVGGRLLGSGIVYKLDPRGKVEWNRRLGEDVNCLLEDSRGNYLVGVENGGPVLFKLDRGGRIEWGIDLPYNTVNAIAELKDGNYLVASPSPESEKNALSMVNQKGEVVWTKYIRGTTYPRAIIATPDGGCVIVGDNSTWEVGPPDPRYTITFYASSDYMIMKLGPDFDIPQESEHVSSLEPTGGGINVPLAVGIAVPVILVLVAIWMRRRKEEFSYFSNP